MDEKNVQKNKYNYKEFIPKLFKKWISSNFKLFIFILGI